MSWVKNERTVAVIAGLALLPSLLVMVGCSKNSASAPGAQDDTALAAAGKPVFDANGCARCHSIGGQGGRMGPDLTRVGADPRHSPQWLVEKVKNPRATNPSSRMPPFEGKISDKDLLALGAYLASLK